MSPMFRTALVLGLLSAVSPFAIDMYLPAQPAIAAEFGATEARAQLTIVAYFISFGLTQLIWGPLADRYGRKAPLYAGMGVFLIGTIGCALAPSMASLIGFRLLQGAGGAVLMVVPRAIIRDQYTGAEGTRLMAMVMLVISVSPMLAPLAGSGVLAFGGWRLVFWVLALVTLAGLAVLHFGQPETLAKEDRVPISMASMLRGAGILFRDPVFMGLTLIGGFGMASFFVFIAFAPFVYQDSYGLSPTGFSLAFAFNAVGFFGASQMAGPLGARFGMVPVMRRAVAGFFGFATLLLVLVLVGLGGLPVVMACLFLANACLGLVIPATMVMALDPHGAIAGLASSLGGTLQMVTGGVMMVLAGPFANGTVVPMVAAIAVCATGALTLSVLVMRRVAVAAA